MERGGVELQADWHIDNRTKPILHRVSPPFRPRPTSDMQQVRVRAYNEVRGTFDYLFPRSRVGFVPVIDRGETLRPHSEHIAYLKEDYRKPNPEDLEWYPVKALESEQVDNSETGKALAVLSPEGGSYVMVSLRRHEN
jgi:hypothetical protein